MTVNRRDYFFLGQRVYHVEFGWCLVNAINSLAVQVRIPDGRSHRLLICPFTGKRVLTADEYKLMQALKGISDETARKTYRS